MVSLTAHTYMVILLFFPFLMFMSKKKNNVLLDGFVSDVSPPQISCIQ